MDFLFFLQCFFIVLSATTAADLTDQHTKKQEELAFKTYITNQVNVNENGNYKIVVKARLQHKHQQSQK